MTELLESALRIPCLRVFDFDDVGAPVGEHRTRGRDERPLGHLEHTAKILLTARLLGRVQTLAPEDVRALELARARAFPGEIYPGCPVPAAERSEA